MVVIVAVEQQESQPTVVREGEKLAAAFDEPLHVIHVLSRSRFRELERTSVDETGEAIELETIREMAEGIANDIAADSTADYTAVGLVGDPAEEILEYANREDTSYIVIGGRKRSKVGKVLFGSVTQSILLSADRPVLTVMNGDE